MAEYTITLTDFEDRVFKALTARFNRENESALTPAEYLQSTVPGFLKPHLDEYNTSRLSLFTSGFNTLTDAHKIILEAALAKEIADQAAEQAKTP